MSTVTPAKSGDTCKHQIVAGRDSHTEDCRGKAIVRVGNVPYCSIHATEHVPASELAQFAAGSAPAS